jgi:hypothetical protein
MALSHSRSFGIFASGFYFRTLTSLFVATSLVDIDTISLRHQEKIETRRGFEIRSGL